MAFHNQIGTIGEDIAVRTMQSKHYRIVEQNWRLGHLEIDIIAENKKEIVFVEVKTRTSTFGGKSPEEAVDLIKRKRMTAAANAYVKYHRIEKDIRFDVIGILLDPNTLDVKELTHLENAFFPPLKTISSHSFNGAWHWHHRRKTIG